MRPESLVIDVGADIGIFTDSFRRWWKGLRCGARSRKYSEPPTRVQQYSYCENTRNNSKRSNGRVPSQPGPYNPAGHCIGDQGLKIPSITVDELVRRAEATLFLLKIDVEGAEPRVLDGAANVISEHRPSRFLEYSPAQIRRLNADSRDLLEWLAAKVYQLSLPPDRTLRSVSGIYSASAHKAYVDLLLTFGAPA